MTQKVVLITDETIVDFAIKTEELGYGTALGTLKAYRWNTNAGIPCYFGYFKGQDRISDPIRVVQVSDKLIEDYPQHYQVVDSL